MAFWGDSALLGDKIIFGADDGVHGYEVWVADATASEPTMVKDILAGGSGDSSSPSWFTRFGDYVYFQANDGEHGYELWRTDGTTDGTTLVKDIDDGVEHSSPSYLTVVGDTLYFVASDGVHGQEVWMSDGSAAGTVLAADLNTTAPNTGSDGAELIAHGGDLWLRANSGIDGGELFRISDTTVTEYDLYSGPLSSNPTQFYSHSDGYLYFQAYDLPTGVELWRASSTSAPALVEDIEVGASDSAPNDFEAYNGRLYFAAHTDGDGRELWSTDGTTVRSEADIWSGSASSNPAELTVLGSMLYYSADDASNRELHRFDGTVDHLVGEIHFSGSSYPSSLTPVGDALYLVASDGSTTGLARIDSASGVISFFAPPGTAGFIGCMCSTILKRLGGRIFAPTYNDEMGSEYSYIDEPTYGLPETNRGDFTAGGWAVLFAAFTAVAGVTLRRVESQRS
jgi:ELWxxDGT repeat protein